MTDKTCLVLSLYHKIIFCTKIKIKTFPNPSQEAQDPKIFKTATVNVKTMSNRIYIFPELMDNEGLSDFTISGPGFVNLRTNNQK